MMYKSLLIVLLVFSVACKHGAKKETKAEILQNTKISFNKEFHSFGDLKQGEIVGCYFVFTNTGNYPLVINEVKPGCGCTAVEFTKEPVAPGKQGEIEVKFDTRGFHGKQYKVIQVYTNVEEKIKELVVSANVVN